MKVKTITYQRVKNLGNYESERLEITAEINEGEKPQEAIERLRELVLNRLNIETEDGGIAF